MSYSYSDTESILDILNGASTIQSLVTLGLSILAIIALWKVFEKAGEPGWAAIIPFYNSYVLCKIAGKKNWFIYMLISSIVLVISAITMITAFAIIVGLSLFSGSDNSDGSNVAVVVLIISMILAIISYIVAIVANFIVCINLAKRFGKSTAFGVGLVFLGYIFYPILAFGNAQYIGPMNAVPYNGYQPINNYGYPPPNPYEYQPPNNYGYQPPNNYRYNSQQDNGYQSPNNYNPQQNNSVDLNKR